MKRLRRILLNAATALSLLLCLATVALWARSFWVAEFFYGYTGHGGGHREVDVWTNGISYTESRWAAKVDEPAGWEHWSVRRNQRLQQYGTSFDAISLGYFDVCSVPFYSTRFVPTNPGDSSGFTLRAHLPWWVLFLASAPLPAMRLARSLRRRSRRGAGRCPACGYDLRATPERCPECGHRPS